MLMAYDELEREMNEIKNNIGKRIDPNDIDEMRAWRERMRSTKERTSEDTEERASQLAETAQRIRDKTYAGARVIEIAPIAEVSTNNPDALANHADRSARLGTTCINLALSRAAKWNKKSKEKRKWKLIRLSK